MKFFMDYTFKEIYKACMNYCATDSCLECPCLDEYTDTCLAAFMTNGVFPCEWPKEYFEDE